MQNISSIQKDLRLVANKTKAKFLAGYFKTGPGEYGAGDVFLGVTVPQMREIAKKYLELDLKQIKTLLHSKIHEFRVSALMVLVYKYEIGSDLQKKNIFNFYVKETAWINNWDLVDLSVSNIVGDYLFNFNKRGANCGELAK